MNQIETHKPLQDYALTCDSFRSDTALMGSSLKGVGKTDFWVGLGSDRLGSTVSRGDARHRSFPVGAWVEVAVDGDVQRVCGREWSARFVRGFSAWEPVRLRAPRANDDETNAPLEFTLEG